MQVVAEEGRLDVLAKFAGRFMASERNQRDAVAFRRLPLTVEPWAGHDEIRMVRIVFCGVAENLPRSPRIFLIPESGDIQIRHGRGMKLVNPRFLFPEFVVVGMLDARIPVRNRSMQVFGVDVRELPEVEVPLVSVVGLELEM